jgi:hypothetical protein
VSAAKKVVQDLNEDLELYVPELSAKSAKVMVADEVFEVGKMSIRQSMRIQLLLPRIYGTDIPDEMDAKEIALRSSEEDLLMLVATILSTKERRITPEWVDENCSFTDAMRVITAWAERNANDMGEAARLESE